MSGHESQLTLESADKSQERTAPSLFSWPALLVLGWVVYELTAQPNLGAALVCAKFGWNDFRTALWLRRNDTHRPRAWSCFWFYFASGLWKMAITATVAIFILALVAAARHQPRARVPQADQAPAMPPWFPAVLLTAMVGFGLSALATVFALLLARRHRIRFWLNAQIHRFRRDNIWPPYDIGRQQPNQAGRVLLTALILLITPPLIVLCITVGRLIAHLGPIGISMAVLIATGGGPVLVLIYRDVFHDDFVARTPWECWGLEEYVMAFDGPGQGDTIAHSQERESLPGFRASG